MTDLNFTKNEFGSRLSYFIEIAMWNLRENVLLNGNLSIEFLMRYWEQVTPDRVYFTFHVFFLNSLKKKIIKKDFFTLKKNAGLECHL